jgi:hypothetical protein
MGSPILVDVDELILRTLVIQFDGRVVDVFRRQNDQSTRMHIAFMKEPEIQPPNRSGSSMVKVAGTVFSVDADELVALRPVLDRIAEAVRSVAANRQPMS